MKRFTRGEAIRKKCLDCCCNSSMEVRLCPSKNCPLYRYRLGHEEREAGNLPMKYQDPEKGQYAPIFPGQNESEVD